MKNITIFIVSLFFATFSGMAQTGNDEESRFTETEIVVNDSVTLRTQEISVDKYETRKQASTHLHVVYKEITNVAKVQRRRPFKVIHVDHGGYTSEEYEIRFKDGTKKHLDFEYSFEAYFPEWDIIIFETIADDYYGIDFKDNSDSSAGNPRYFSVSPDKRWRVNCEGPNQCSEGYLYFLEKLNPTTKKYEFVCNLFGVNEFGSSRWPQQFEWLWEDDETVLYSNGESSYNEMKITAK